MKVVDSSGWLEFFTGGRQAEAFAEHLADPADLATPTIVLYEVHKIVKRERGDEDATVASAVISKTALVPLSAFLALAAADLSLQHRLGMADAIVYATAQAVGGTLVTSDADFERLPGVTYISAR